jgi:hypothetical protein
MKEHHTMNTVEVSAAGTVKLADMVTSHLHIQYTSYDQYNGD